MLVVSMPQVLRPKLGRSSLQHSGSPDQTKGKQKRTDEEALADLLGLHTYLIE